MLYRRKFIKKLGLLFTTTPLLLIGKTKPEDFKLTTLRVAGLQYAEMMNDVFVPAERLQLKREADNAYDKYAIAIYKNDKKVGYIPKDNTHILASMIDNGVVLRVEVRYFDKKKPVWDKLWIGVWQVT